jgi:hypothetical protein
VTLTVDDFTATQQTRRDRWGRYLVVPLISTKPEGYTRATTVAKTLDDGASLKTWAQRMVAIGLHDRADLLAQVGQARDDKRALNALVERAAEAGGATVRRDLGTAIHAMVERAILTGETPTGPHAADVVAILGAIDAGGFDVVACERIVVNDAAKIAGTADLFLRRRSDGVHLIGDLKTGSSVAYGALGWACQLAIYATADAYYTQGAADDGSEDVREPLPELSHDEAVIIHCEPGTADAKLYALDLTVGREALALALAVREIRKAKPLSPLELTPGGDSADAEPAPGGDSADAIFVGPQPADPERVAWVVERIEAIKAAGGVDRLAAAWPEGIATLKVNPTPTDTELLCIEDAVGTAETALGIPFGDAAPGSTLDAFPIPVVEVTEYVDPDDPRIAKMRNEYRNLPTDLQVVVDAVRTEHNVPKLTSGRATEAHLELVNAALREARTEADARYVVAKAHYDVFHRLTKPAMVERIKPALLAVALAGIGDEGLRCATASSVENLGLLADAWQARYIAQEGDRLVSTPEGIDAAKQRHARKALTIARGLCESLGYERPASAVDALAHPLVCAHLALA